MSAAALRVVLVGNSNCGKTALFNRLTGSRQKVANYPGVTVERKEGRFLTPGGRIVQVLDLPGAYSLTPTSPDEAITRDVCCGTRPGEPPADLLVCVADATNLRLHLRFVLELRALGRPLLVALNMMDAAAARGIEVDSQRLAAELGVPVVETIAVRRGGTAALLAVLDTQELAPPPAPPVSDAHTEARRLAAACIAAPPRVAALDEAIDRFLLHPALGLVVLATTMFLMFQAVFSWAQPLMNAITAGFDGLGQAVVNVLPPGVLRSLLVDGVIAGAGSVLVFLLQILILILFLFILLLEESGYLPRAAFLRDRLMVGAGLTGRSFIPLLSSFACAVPGIMATRTIQDPRDRLATILVAPLITCSARLPVYALLISAFIPVQAVGPFNLQGLVLFGLYAAGIAGALAVAWVFKRWRHDGTEHALSLELPS